MAQRKVLIVDDEADIIDLLAYNLEQEGFTVMTAMDGETAIDLAREEKPDLVLLDIMMPKMDGIEACRQIRAIPELKQVYIIFLTARSEEYSEVAGFDVGADDYISKPIKPRVLISRIKAVMRREQAQDTPDVLKVHDLEILRDEYVVKHRDQILNLPRKEFELLYFLAARRGKVFSRDVLLQNVWGDVFVVDRTVDVHVRKLREKIGEKYIQTIKGVGYKFLGE
jgi:two-component system, OmpR family, alkaline phosphatase synthesis response regulator PhoP